MDLVVPAEELVYVCRPHLTLLACPTHYDQHNVHKRYVYIWLRPRAWVGSYGGAFDQHPHHTISHEEVQNDIFLRH